jgi:hypothetical protein
MSFRCLPLEEEVEEEKIMEIIVMKLNFDLE